MCFKMAPALLLGLLVTWAEQDGFVGYCPDLFPLGGICYGATEEETYQLSTSPRTRA